MDGETLLWIPRSDYPTRRLALPPMRAIGSLRQIAALCRMTRRRDSAFYVGGLIGTKKTDTGSW